MTGTDQGNKTPPRLIDAAPVRLMALRAGAGVPRRLAPRRVPRRLQEDWHRDKYGKMGTVNKKEGTETGNKSTRAETGGPENGTP